MFAARPMRGAHLSPGSRGEQCNQITLIERGVQISHKMNVSAVFEDVDKVTEGPGSGKQLLRGH